MKNKRRGFFYIITPLLIYIGINIAVSISFVMWAQLRIFVDSSVTSAQEFYDKVYEIIINSQMLIMLVTNFVCILVFALMFAFSDRKRHDALYVNKLGFKGVLSAVILGAACYLLVYTIIILLDPFIPEIIQQNNDMINSYLTVDWLSIFVITITSPVCEELLFRGLLFNRIRETRSIPNAVIVSGIVFGLMHMPNYLQMIYAAFLGMAMAWAYFKYENILVPVIMHIVFNAFNFIPVSYLISTDIGLCIYCVIVVVLAAAAFNILRKKPHASLKEINTDSNDISPYL